MAWMCQPNPANSEPRTISQTARILGHSSCIINFWAQQEVRIMTTPNRPLMIATSMPGGVVATPGKAPDVGIYRHGSASVGAVWDPKHGPLPSLASKPSKTASCTWLISFFGFRVCQNRCLWESSLVPTLGSWALNQEASRDLRWILQENL